MVGSRLRGQRHRGTHSLPLLIGPFLVITLSCQHETREAIAGPSPEQVIEESVPSTILDHVAKEPQELANPTFQPEAKVELVDGRYLELAEFSFFSGRYRPSFYTPGSRQFHGPHYVPLKLDELWDEVPLEKIREVRLEKNRGSGYMPVVIALLDGQELSGMLPVEAYPTWIRGQDFGLQGRQVVFGTEGEFDIAVKRVRSFRREEGDSWAVVDENGKRRLLKNLEYGVITDQDMNMLPRGIDEFGRNAWLRFDVDETEIELKLGDLSRLSFDSNQVRIIKRSGEEATGTLISNVQKIFGRTEPGRIWFGDIEEVRSVDLLEP